MASMRTQRVGDEMMSQISKILYTVKDPRLSCFITITRVDVSGDLKYAKVFYSVFGDEETQKKAEQGFKASTGYIRRELAHNMNLRYTPELNFVPDLGIARARQTLDVINNLVEAEKKDASESD